MNYVEVEVWINGFFRYRWKIKLETPDWLSLEIRTELREKEISSIILYLQEKVLPSFNPDYYELYIIQQSKMNNDQNKDIREE